MIQFGQRIAHIVISGLILFAGQSSVGVNKAEAQVSTVKYVYAIDYPLAQKIAYLEWVKSVVDILQAPEEVKRITSYDNCFGASPHRFIEFEFDNLGAAGRYFERPEVNKIFEDVVNHGVNASVTVLKQRGDYNKQGGEPTAGSTVKYVYAIDYPLAQKAAYLEWVKSIVDALQTPEEVKRITSYDSYFGTSPHRFIEFQFHNLEAAGKYFERPEVKKVFEDVVNHGINASITALKLRGDYARQ